jgi:toxin YhaV
VIQRHGWTLLFHDCLIEQLEKLHLAARRAMAHDPDNYTANANYKLFMALSRLILDTVPIDPGKAEYRQGNTMGPQWRHWRRAKIGQRFRLFFRYDSTAKIIVFAWVNDAQTLRAKGGKNDPYVVFQRMLSRGTPPDSWDELIVACTSDLGSMAEEGIDLHKQ